MRDCMGLCIDNKVLVDMQYRLLCSPKPKNSFLTPDHKILTILASYHQLFSFSTPNPPKKWYVTYGWPRFEMIMVWYFCVIRIFIYCAAGRKKVDSARLCFIHSLSKLVWIKRGFFIRTSFDRLWMKLFKFWLLRFFWIALGFLKSYRTPF